MISTQTLRSKLDIPAALARLTRLLNGNEWPKSGYEITVKLARRTNPQNAYYWGVVVPMVADHLTERHNYPYTTDMAHFLLRSQFLPAREDPITKRKEYGSTTDLVRSGDGEDSWGVYIQKIQEWAAKSGLYIPDPQEEV